MNKEEIFLQLFDKIPANANLGIFGLNSLASSIYYDIKQKRDDINFCGFINDVKTANFEGQQVFSIKDCLDNNICNYILNTTINNYVIENILDVYNIQFSTINNFVIDYYKNKHGILNDNNYKKVIDIYDSEEDKKLFDMIFKRRKRLDDDRFLAQHYFKNYSKGLTVNRTIKYQYLEKINKEPIKIILDLGFNKGFNAIAYNKLLKNLQKIYAFEAIYDICRDKFIESFILNDKLTIEKAIVGDENKKTQFYINLKNINASISEFANSFSDKNITTNSHKIVEIDMVTIDKYCKENLVRPDFIKMDIEGSELLALKGGINTITAYRPQLAISIYHCDGDFINIPLYLYENLENYVYKLGHYSTDINESVLYAVPKEIAI